MEVSIINIMEIRKYRPGEESSIWDIFYNTIHFVNSQDYSQEQINAWAPADLDKNIWLNKIAAIDPYVVLVADQIVAYADLQEDGYIDHFFCHYEYQRQGIGSFLFSHLEKIAISKGFSTMSSDVSISAKPFFELKGFVVLQRQLLTLRGQKLINFKMIRSLSQKLQKCINP